MELRDKALGTRGLYTAALCLEQHFQSSSLKKLHSAGRMLLRAHWRPWDSGRLSAGSSGSPKLLRCLWRPLPVVSLKQQAGISLVQMFGVSSGVFHRKSC